MMKLSSSALGNMSSISSLGASNTGVESVSEEGDFVQTSELYQRLRDLEQMTRTFLLEKPINLTDQNDSFTDIDKGSSQDFDLIIKDFSHDEVLCITIFCVPDCLEDETFHELNESPQTATEHQSLDIILRRVSSVLNSKEARSSNLGAENEALVSFTPLLHNGEYTFSLTTALGLVPGVYVLSVKNLGITTQPIRVSKSILPAVRAIPVKADQKVLGTCSNGEYAYYRFTASPIASEQFNKLITVRVKAVCDASGNAIGDPDLYVGNRFKGLVAVTKENCVWKSTNVGADRVDIHPIYDLNMRRGNTFIIGVLGYKERNDFELEVTISDPAPIRRLQIGETVDVLLPAPPADSKYFSLQVPVPSDASRSRGATGPRIFLTVTPLPSLTDLSELPDGDTNVASVRANPEYGEDFLARLISQSYGRCVYTSDGLAALGMVGKGAWEDRALTGASGIPRIPSLIAAQTSVAHESATVVADSILAASLTEILPPSLARSSGLYPVVHLSSGCMYPSAEEYSWRGSSVDGSVLVMFETDEWRYTNGICHIALSAIKVPTDPSNSSGVLKDDGQSLKRSSSSGAISGASRSKSPTKDSRVEKLQAASTYINCRISIWESSATDRLSSDIRERYEIFQKVFTDIDGSNLSQRERSRIGREDQALTYGEVDYLSFVEVLQAAGASAGDSFFDLGCGAGKGVVSAALSNLQLACCVGIELLPGLCELARTAVTRARNFCHGSHDLPALEIREGDILASDWSGADIVYASSICFSDNFVQAIFEKSKALKPGAKFITLKLPQGMDSWFEVESQAWYRMSWGRIVVYILKRTAIYE